MNVQEEMRRAVAAHRSGNLDEARRLYQKVLRAEPRHVDALNLMGVVQLQGGDAERAIDSLRRALKEQSQRADTHFNLALALKAQGLLEEAEAAFARTLELQPAHPEALTGLGILALGRRDAQAARAWFEKALALNPFQPEALSNLAVALRLLGRDEEALPVLERAVRSAPHLAEAHENLRGLVKTLRGLDGAIAHQRTLVVQMPKSAEARLALARSLVEAGQLAEAADLAVAAVALQPEHGLGQLMTGQLLISVGRHRDAVAHLHRATELLPGHAEPWRAAATALLRLHFLDGAERCLREALRIDPSDPATRSRLANLVLVQGGTDEARSLFDGLAADPDPGVARLGRRGLAGLHERLGDPEAARQLAEPLADGDGLDVLELWAKLARTPDERARTLAGIDARLAQGGLDDVQTSELHFAAAGLLDRLDRPAEAFARYRTANATRGERFDRAAHEQFVDRILRTFAIDVFPSLASSPSHDERPVLVVGLPRSGTTLVEQILDAHPRARGVGELEDLHALFTRLSVEGVSDLVYPELARGVTGAQLADLVRPYRDRLRALAPDADRVVDKMPGNVLHLGFLARALPGAHFVHVVRDLMDVGLSLFQQRFVGGHPYAYDLEDIGTYMRDYARIVRHWRVLGLRMHEVRYEDLVARPEVEARRLVEFVGLPWDDRCLRFHESRRFVGSASYAQVRQPLYTSSVGRWRRHEAELEPLRRIVEAIGPL